MAKIYGTSPQNRSWFCKKDAEPVLARLVMYGQAGSSRVTSPVTLYAIISVSGESELGPTVVSGPLVERGSSVKRNGSL